MATTLDDALISRLSKCLCFAPDKDQLDYTFRFEGPLGTFSRRMEIASLFGFIEDATYQELDIFREMRNACAHSKHNVSFEDAALPNVARRLFRPQVGFMPPPEDDPGRIKVHVMAEALFLIATLWEGGRDKGAKGAVATLNAIISARTGAAPSPSPDKPT